MDLSAYFRQRLNPTHAPFPVACMRRTGFGRQQLAEVFGLAQFRRGAEIGVAQGKFSRVLCEAIPTLETLLCVDPWTSYHGNRRGGRRAVHRANHQAACAALAPFPAAQLVCAMSLEAVQDVPLGSLDFVYLDGNHDYPFVRDDLAAWAPRVRSGGVVAGDDYYAFRHAGVIQAVDEFVAMHGIAEWYQTCNRSRSWFWVQP